MTTDRVAYGVTILRLVTGLIFFVHGLQKVFSFGLEGTAGFLSSVGIPAAGVLAPLLITVEVLGGLALLLGFYTRYASIVLGVAMLVALFTVHLPNGFFAADNGYELVLLLIGACAALFFLGSGALSVDGVLTTRRPVAVARS